MTNTAEIIIDNVSYEINGRLIIKNLSFTIPQGDFVVLLGANGCGKSTLMNLIAGNIQPTKGFIKFTNPNFKLAKSLKIMTQNSFDSLFVNLSVYDNYVVLNHKLYHSKIMAKHEFALYIKKFNVNLSAKLDTTIDFLSGGERQALVLALLTCYTPELLLLDEHTSALDPVAANNIMSLTNKLVRDLHISCLLTTHDLDIAQKYGDKILVLGQDGSYRVVNSDEKKLLTVEYMKHNFY